MIIALDLKVTVTATAHNGGSDFVMKPVDLKTYKQLSVEFDAIDQLEQTRRQQAGMTLFRGGAITRRTYHTKYLDDVIDDAIEEETQFGVEAAEAAFYQSEQFMQWAIAHHQAELQEDQANKEREAVRGTLPNSGRGGGGGDAAAGGVAASQTSTVEALAGGGASAATRDEAQAVTTQAI